MSRISQVREAIPWRAIWNVTKTLFQTSVIWGIFLLAFPAMVLLMEDEGRRFAATGWRIAGAGLFVLAGAFCLACGILIAVRGDGTPLPFDGTRRLVFAGPYRYIRNPMVIAGLLQGVAVGLWLGSPAMFFYVFAGYVVWDLPLRTFEERDLVRRFGDEYRLYRRRVRCWRMRRTPWDPSREASEPALAAEWTTPPERAILLFDGQCQFCTAQMERLLRHTPAGFVEPISQFHPGVPERFPGLPQEALLTAMHLIEPNGRVVPGIEAAVRTIYLSRPIVGKLALVYYLPIVRLLADRAYAAIARRRFKLGSDDGTAGACRIHR